MIINLKINDIEIPLDSSETLEQTFQPIAGEALRRLNNGTAVKMVSWTNKYRITTNGSGRIPLPLTGIDYSQPVIMDCSAPMSVHGATNSIALPAGFTYNAINYTSWRDDVSMIGHAVVNGKLVHSAITSIVDTIVTLATKPGANGYQVTYWPRFLAYAGKPTESQGLRGGDRRLWEILAETV
ncbi:MAG: hypothetical protein IBX56_08330 [Methylomicrobium sp.]|nr:hypothetical protein [Methylomicrobium sp.]